MAALGAVSDFKDVAACAEGCAVARQEEGAHMLSREHTLTLIYLDPSPDRAQVGAQDLGLEVRKVWLRMATSDRHRAQALPSL